MVVPSWQQIPPQHAAIQQPLLSDAGDWGRPLIVDSSTILQVLTLDLVVQVQLKMEPEPSYNLLDYTLRITMWIFTASKISNLVGQFFSLYVLNPWCIWPQIVSDEFQLFSLKCYQLTLYFSLGSQVPGSLGWDTSILFRGTQDQFMTVYRLNAFTSAKA
jgi:hypothetical protein